jgi:hypothetical protein
MVSKTDTMKGVFVNIKSFAGRYFPPGGRDQVVPTRMGVKTKLNGLAAIGEGLEHDGPFR